VRLAPAVLARVLVDAARARQAEPGLAFGRGMWEGAALHAYPKEGGRVIGEILLLRREVPRGVGE